MGNSFSNPVQPEPDEPPDEPEGDPCPEYPTLIKEDEEADLPTYEEAIATADLKEKSSRENDPAV